MVSPQSLVVDEKKQDEKDEIFTKLQSKSFVVADIGCDHAYVSIALIERNLAQKVIAMDVRKGPLEIAAKNIAEYGFEEYIDIRLSDGMEKLAPGEADAIVIAGMGGLLMRNILSNGLHVMENHVKQNGKLGDDLPEVKRPVLILQPQSDIREVRYYLQTCSYCIEKEQMLIDEGKYYTVIRAVPTRQVDVDALERAGGEAAVVGAGEAEEDKAAYSEVELVYGRYGLQHKDRVLYEFLQKEAEVLCQIAGKLQDSITKSRLENREIPEKTMERLQSVKEEQRLNEEALSYFIQD